MDTLSWFPFSILSVLLFGISMVLYKLPSTKNVSRVATTFWVMAFSFLFSILLFYPSLSLIDSKVVMFGALWGGSFAILTILQMYVLAHIDTNVLLPSTSSLSLVVAIVIGFFLFSDILTPIQLIGVVLAVVSVYMSVYKKGKLEYSLLLLSVGASIIAMSAFNKIIQKIAVDAVDIRALQISQYLLGAILVLTIIIILRSRGTSKINLLAALPAGLYISMPSFLGGYTILIALTKGPFTLITAVHSTYIFITAVLGYLFFKENLTVRKVALLVLAIIAIILIKIG